jgi:hypothetical protein
MACALALVNHVVKKSAVNCPHLRLEHGGYSPSGGVGVGTNAQGKDCDLEWMRGDRYDGVRVTASVRAWP